MKELLLMKIPLPLPPAQWGGGGGAPPPAPSTPDEPGDPMSAPHFLYEKRGHVALCTFNRPEKKNAFDDPQWDGLRDALQESREDGRVAAMLVTGAGEDFSASRLNDLLRDTGAPADAAPVKGWWHRVATIYVAAVVHVSILVEFCSQMLT